MASRCSCVGCDKPTVVRLQARLNPIQKAMLGYFCVGCIMKKCDSSHKESK